MSKYYAALTFCLLSFCALAQSGSHAEFLKSVGGAMIVRNIDSAEKWYASVFAIPVVSRSNDPNGEYKVVIMEGSDIILELLQLRSSINKKSVLEHKADGTQVTGHFKLAFRTTNMNLLLSRLEDAQIKVPRVWTNDETGKRNFIIEDPDGNLIQFLE